MKKLLSLIMATLTALTLTVSATACTPKDDATIEVGILQVATHSALDAAREGFKEVVDAWAKEKGKTVKYNEQNANGDPTAEVTIAEGMIAKNPDLVLGIRPYVKIYGVFKRFTQSRAKLLRHSTRFSVKMKKVKLVLGKLRCIASQRHIEKLAYVYAEFLGEPRQHLHIR